MADAIVLVLVVIVCFACFFIAFRWVRNAVLLFVAYVLFRRDPLDFVLWFVAIGACMLAWGRLLAWLGDADEDEPLG